MTESIVASGEFHRFEHVVCPGCGCVCDDLQVEVDPSGAPRVTGQGCGLAVDWFERHSTTTDPVATLAGQPVPLERALHEAARLLNAADAPLIYGLSRSDTPGQRKAVELAERLQATIDTTASQCHGPSILALQDVGEVTSTLGEVRNRADLVIYWGCHPAETHPRHAERYAAFPTGRHLPRGRGDRCVVLVGPAPEVETWRLDRQGSLPDLIIPLEPGSDFEALGHLRMLLQAVRSPRLPRPREELGRQLDRSAAGGPGGVAGAPTRSGPPSRLQHARQSREPAPASRGDPTRWDRLSGLFTRMLACRYGVVFFGMGLTGMVAHRGPANPLPGQHVVAQLLRLVAELNSHTRFVARRMRLYGDVTGADNVLCWQTGYPFAVNLQRGWPRFNPGEFTANELLARNEIDICLLVGSETWNLFDSAALATLRRIPTVVLDHPGERLPFEPTIRFTTAPCGLATRGTMYRMDGVPLPQRVLIPSPYPTDELVLGRLAEALGMKSTVWQTGSDPPAG